VLNPAVEVPKMLVRLSFISPPFSPAMPDLLPIHLLTLGQRAHIDQVLGCPDQVHRLQELGMRVGTPVEMVQSGSPCIVKLDGNRLAFRDNEVISVLVRLGERS